MANFALPTTASLYADVITNLNGKLSDLALGLDPAVSSPSNLPTNSIRYSSAAAKWQKWNGTAWVDLAATYAISISGNAATATSATSAASAATLTTARSINGTSFNGSANITTALWGTARSITLGSTTRSVNGSANVTWTLADMGADVYRTIPAGTGSGQLETLTAGKTISTGPAAGSVHVLFNNTNGPLTLTQGAGVTLRLDGTDLTGNRTLLLYGKCSVHWITTTLAVVSGSVV